MTYKITSLHKLSSMDECNKIAIDAKQRATMQNNGIQANRLWDDTLDAFSYDDACQEHTKHNKQQPKIVLNTTHAFLKS